MNFDTHMVRDQTHDPLSVGGRNTAAGVLKSTRQPIDPKSSIGIEHHLDDAGVFEVTGDGRTKGGAQHARAAGEGFGSKRNIVHMRALDDASFSLKR